MLTQQALASILNLSPKTISKWETDVGIPNLPYIVPLAQALGVTTDELLRGSDVAQSEPAEKSSVHPFINILEAYGIRLELNLIQTGGLETENKIDYRRIAEEVQKTLPGEVISVSLSTTTRSSGSDKYAFHGESWSIKCPTHEDIAAMLDGLFAPGNSFAILFLRAAPSESADYCALVQTAVLEDDDPKRGEGQYVVDAQFAYGGGKCEAETTPKRKTKQYSIRTDDIGAVKEIFRAFASGTEPDITGWRDITQELNLG
jgi:transcriptional regulator with XRE-family HTH domain